VNSVTDITLSFHNSQLLLLLLFGNNLNKSKFYSGRN